LPGEKRTKYLRLVLLLTITITNNNKNSDKVSVAEITNHAKIFPIPLYEWNSDIDRSWILRDINEKYPPPRSEGMLTSSL